MAQKKKKNTQNVGKNGNQIKNKNTINQKQVKNSANANTKVKTKKIKQKSKAKKIIIRILIGLLVLLLIAAGIIAGVIFGIFQKYSIPIDKIRASSENTVILDTDGNVIATLSADEKRDSIKLDEMAKYLPTAFVAIEDERFYEHQGVDIKRTAAATFAYVFKGNSSFGGSTITQQLVKNITREDERDATRKIKEMARAYNLEKTLTKDEILELYLNMIFMGEDVYGVQMASKLYFNKNASELDLAECAFLAGINNSPNAYRPFEDSEEMREKIKTRTLTVINKMHDLGKIESDEIYNAAVEKVQNGLVFTKGDISANIYSYHTDALIQQVIAQVQEENPDMTPKAAEYYVYNGGLTIYSTQVTSIQTAMEEEYKNTKYLQKSRENYIKDENGNEINATTQSAMVIIDQKTGQVVATVGGFGEKTSRGLNRATQAPKLAGSSIKPLAVIAPSLEAGLITAGTVIDDSPTATGWPKNDDRTYKGLTTVRTIIKYSRNVPEVKMINNLGPQKSVEFLRNLGITTISNEDANPSLALGAVTNGVSVLEMAGAYAAIANDGVYIEPTFYTKIVDSNGNVVLEPNQETRTVMSADNAYILKSILRGPVQGGTASAYGVQIPNIDTCAKTGTTDKYTDRWLCGFTPYYTAAAWYGFDKTEIPANKTNFAASIWGVVMKKAHTGLESKYFQKTGNIISAPICNKSGLIATDLCRKAGCAYSEEFVKGTVPNKSCETHVIEKICTGEDGTKRIATDFCPNVTEEIFITRPNRDKDTSWKSAADASLMVPTETCEIHKQEVEPSPSPEPSPSATPSPVASPSIKPSPKPSSKPSPTPEVKPSPSAKPSPSNPTASSAPVVTTPVVKPSTSADKTP